MKKKKRYSSIFKTRLSLKGRDSGSQNGETERWNEPEKWSDRGSRSGSTAPRDHDVRRDEEYTEPPAPRNDRWKEPEPRAEERTNSRWNSDDVRRTTTRRDEVAYILLLFSF